MAATLTKVEREYLASMQQFSPRSVSKGKCDRCGMSRTLVDGECAKCSIKGLQEQAEDYLGV